MDRQKVCQRVIIEIGGCRRRQFPSPPLLRDHAISFQARKLGRHRVAKDLGSAHRLYSMDHVVGNEATVWFKFGKNP